MNDSIPAVPVNPFRRPAPHGWGVEFVEVCGVEDRLRLVDKMTASELESVLSTTVPVQRTVRKAAERRLRKIQKNAKP